MIRAGLAAAAVAALMSTTAQAQIANGVMKIAQPDINYNGGLIRAKRVARTRAGNGELVMRGIEVAAALVIVAFGALLLTGYMVTERMVGI